MSIASQLRKLKNANYSETEPLQLPDGMMVVLSTLDGDTDRTIADYLRMHMGKSLGHYTKLESLAHAICWIQPSEGEAIDLRGLSYIETGEVLKNGVEVKVRRHVFMREIVNSWPDIVVDTLFAKYAQLMDALDDSIRKTIKVELGDTTLQMKINAISDELRELVQDAMGRGLDVDAELSATFGAKNITDADSAYISDALSIPEPIPETTPETTPEPVHHIDEQLARERAENPEVYPVPLAQPDLDVVDEVPQSIRR